jgi:ribosome-binding factor A
MANPQRLRRVADQIQRELSGILRTELKDPRVSMVTLTGVEVSADLAHATIYYSSLSDVEARSRTEQGLRSAAGFLRANLGRRLALRIIPELRFVFDASVEQGAHLSKLIDEVTSENGPRAD